MDHGAERSEAPIEQFPGRSRPGRGASSGWWVRCSLDLSEDLETVLGFSWEVHDGHEVVEVLTTTVPRDASPVDCLRVVLAELHRRYGVQMELALF
jgi:hypothetical protein